MRPCSRSSSPASASTRSSAFRSPSSICRRRICGGMRGAHRRAARAHRLPRAGADSARSDAPQLRSPGEGRLSPAVDERGCPRADRKMVTAKGALTMLRSIRTVRADIDDDGPRTPAGRVDMPTTTSIRYPGRIPDRRTDCRRAARPGVQRRQYWIRRSRRARGAAAFAKEIRAHVQRDIIPLLLALADRQVGATRVADVVEGDARCRCCRRGGGDAPVTLVFDPDTLIVSTRSASDMRSRRRGRAYSDYRDVHGVQVAFKAESGATARRRRARRAQLSTSTCRSTSRSSPNRAEPGAAPLRVMISCGEPSGDLYAARSRPRSCARPAPAVITGFGGDRLPPPAPRSSELQRLVGDRAAGGRARAAATYATYRRLVAEARANRPDVFVAIDFPDFNFRLAPRAPQARRAGRLLHQPAALGVAPRPHEDDAADCRSRAGHLPVRRGDLPGSGRAGRVGRPSAARCAAGAASRGAFLREQLGAGPDGAGGRAAAGQPPQRAARDPAGRSSRQPRSSALGSRRCSSSSRARRTWATRSSSR